MVFLFGRWLIRFLVRLIVIALVFIAGFWLRGTGVGQEGTSGNNVFWQIIPDSAKEKMYDAIRDGVREALISYVGTLPSGTHLDLGVHPMAERTDASSDRLPVDRHEPQGIPDSQTASAPDDVFHHGFATPTSLITLLEKVSQTMTAKEKETFLAWAETHLTPDDLTVLNDLLGQGLTADSLAKVYQTMQGRWKDEDFAYIFSLLMRYEAAQALLEGGNKDQTMPVFGPQSSEEPQREQ